jgi:DNA polymerase III sliding clamp (beta) subunit (PCNA family)
MTGEKPMATKKTLLEKDFISFFRDLPLKCIASDDNRFVFNGVHYRDDGITMEGSDGRCAIVIKTDNKQIYNQLFKDKIVARDNTIIEGNYPDVDNVIPNIDDPKYSKLNFKIDSFVKKLDYSTLPNQSILIQKFNENAVINLSHTDNDSDYLFAIRPEYISLFADYTMELYYNTESKNSPILIKNTVWDEKYNLKMIYVAMPIKI